MMKDGMIGNDWNEQERRRYERYSVTFYLSVYDQQTNVLLGQIIDISRGGMRLISQEPIPAGKHFHLVLDVSLESGKQQKVLLEARSIWSQEDDNPDLFATGFQFIDLSQEAVLCIQEIIAELQGR